MDTAKRLCSGAGLLARGAQFTALVASNDDMAIGAARALHRAGKRIPQDVSLLSFDDIPMAWFFEPPLTTVHVPVGEMIQHTLDKLVLMLDGQSSEPLSAIEGRLMIRDSVAPAPGRTVNNFLLAGRVVKHFFPTFARRARPVIKRRRQLPGCATPTSADNR